MSQSVQRKYGSINLEAYALHLHCLKLQLKLKLELRQILSELVSSMGMTVTFYLSRQTAGQLLPVQIGDHLFF